MKVARWFAQPVTHECCAFDDEALKEWIVAAFGIRSQEEADWRIGEINARQERIAVDRIAYRIPDECYKTMTITSEVVYA